MQTQTDEADRQHDQHSLNEHFHELVDRAGHGLGLVLNLHQLDARRQTGVQTAAQFLERFAERDDVATLGHGHAQRNHFLALVAHFDNWRVDVATLDVSNVAEPQLVAGTAPNRHRLELLKRFKLPAHTHLQHIQRCLHGPG